MSSYPVSRLPIHVHATCPTPPPGPPPRAPATAIHKNRASVLNGRIVSTDAKGPPAGANPEDLRPEWTHELVQTVPAAVAATAREGARRIGLDYAGVAVVVDRRTGRAHCLEANAAPGMSGQTLGSLYAHPQQTLRRRLERAS
jgi:hypothetical protein